MRNRRWKVVLSMFGALSSGDSKTEGGISGKIKQALLGEKLFASARALRNCLTSSVTNVRKNQKNAGTKRSDYLCCGQGK